MSEDLGSVREVDKPLSSLSEAGTLTICNAESWKWVTAISTNASTRTEGFKTCNSTVRVEDT